MGLGCHSDSRPTVGKARSFQDVCSDRIQSSAIPSKKVWNFHVFCKRLGRRHSAGWGPPEGDKSVARASVHPRPAPPGGPLASRKVHVKTLHACVKTLHSSCGISAKIAGTMAGRRCSGGAARSAAARSAAGGPGRVAVVQGSRRSTGGMLLKYCVF